MAVKIAGIALIGLSIIGLLIWLRWYITRCDEAEWKKAEQKRMQRRDDNDFIIKVFQEASQDQTQYISELHVIITRRDEEINDLKDQLHRLQDTASRCYIKDIKHQEVEQ